MDYDSHAFVDDTALRNPRTFDLIVVYQLDPADFIRIYATRPEHYDRIIEIVESHKFVQE
jgi:hypothetical protein